MSGDSAAIDPQTVGHATQYRAIDIGKMPGRLETAPEGYEWAALPTSAFGMGGTVLLCCRCASFVATAEAHDEWHEAVGK